MNNQNSKLNPSIQTNLRVISGRFKKTSKQLISISTSSKKPFLKQYSMAMQQKLQNLKQKISEKKKQKNNQQASNQIQSQTDSKLSIFLKDKVKLQERKVQQIIQNQIVKERFNQFLVINNLLIYQNLFRENQIDSLDILSEVTQKQLEQIGIAKGHALKLKVNLLKYNQNQQKVKKWKFIHQNKAKDTEKAKTSFWLNKQTEQTRNQQTSKQIESKSIGTQNDNLQPIAFVSVNSPRPDSLFELKIRSKFCLFCYQRISTEALSLILEYCSSDCQDSYNNMFNIYEKNLLKVEQQFTKQDNTSRQINNKDQNTYYQQNIENSYEENNYDFLDENKQMYQEFNQENYYDVKRRIQDK